MREDVAEVGAQAHERRPLAANTLTHAIQRPDHVGALTRVQRAEPHLGIQDAALLLDLEGDAHLAGDVHATDLDLVDDAVELDVEQRVVAVRLGKVDDTVQEAGVILEVATNQVIAVADAGALLTVGGQQQAGILDTARGQHEDLGLDGGRHALQGADLGAFHRAAPRVALQLDDVGLDVDLDVLGRLELATIGFAHLQRRTVLGDDLFNLLGVEGVAGGLGRQSLGGTMGGLAGIAHPVGRVVIVGRDLQDGMRALVERLQVCTTDGPAAGIHPRAMLERALIPRTAETAPTVAAATQEAAASAIGEVVGDAHAGPPVKVGSGFITGKAAALKHDGVDAGFLQLQRHGDACSAAADDTDLGLNDGARGQFVGVDQHGWFLLGTQCCEGKHLTLKGKCLSSSG